MKTLTRLLSIMLIAGIIFTLLPTQMNVPYVTNSGSYNNFEINNKVLSLEYDPHINVTLISPTNHSLDIKGVLNITFEVHSTYSPLNLTVAVQGQYVSNYINRTINNGTVFVLINTTQYRDGQAYIDNWFRDTYGHLTHVVVEVFLNNHEAPKVEILSPTEGSRVTGLFNITLNISSDYAQVNLTVYVDGKETPEYNTTVVPSGIYNAAINGSRYTNGEHNVTVLVKTMEGLTDTNSTTLNFFDYIRFKITSNENYDVVSGIVNITLRVDAITDNNYAWLLVDNETDPQVNGIHIGNGTQIISFDSTKYDDGHHTILIILRDSSVHKWNRTVILTFDNHHEPNATWIGPTYWVVSGQVTFQVQINSDYSKVNVTVYIDDEIVPEYNNTEVSSGLFQFTIDTAKYSETKHTIKVVITTPEGLSYTLTHEIAFSNLSTFEIVSFVALIAVAFFLLLRRYRSGQPMHFVVWTVIFYALFVAGIMWSFGTKTLEDLYWHINLASVWSIGLVLIGLIIFIEVLESVLESTAEKETEE